MIMCYAIHEMHYFQKTPTFLNNSKSPCWYEGSKLRCVPYFFMVGVFKCGTTDLFRRITRHPEVLMGLKEIHWFTKLRKFGKDVLLINQIQHNM